MVVHALHCAWWARLGLNQRPPPCEDGALPLSYAPDTSSEPEHIRSMPAVLSRKRADCVRQGREVGDRGIRLREVRIKPAVAARVIDDPHAGGPCSSDVVPAVAHHYSAFGWGAERRQRRQQRPRIRLANAVQRIAADNGGKSIIQAKIGQNIARHLLRLVGADAERQTGSGQVVEGFLHTGVCPGLQAAAALVEVQELPCEACRVFFLTGVSPGECQRPLDQDTCTVANDRDNLVQRQGAPFLCGEQGIESRAQVRRTVDQGPIQVENYNRDRAHRNARRSHVKDTSAVGVSRSVWHAEAPSANLNHLQAGAVSTMSQRKTGIIVLAAGLGTRMKSALPKVMHPIAGRPMIAHLLANLAELAPDRLVVVIGEEMDSVQRAVTPHATVVQKERLGTGHAVMAARDAMAGFDGDVLVVYGDTPLLSAATLARMLEVRRSAPFPAVVVLGFRPDDPGAYGRLIEGDDGGLDAIVEAKDATTEQQAVGLCNSGVMAIDGSRLFSLLDRVGNDNAKGEYYLTDIVALARADGLPCRIVEGGDAELIGVNSRAELAVAERIVQEQLRDRAMTGGATLIDPASVFLCHDTQLGRDVVIGPSVVFGPGVTIADRVEIRAFCHLEGVSVATGALVGPFARLRPGAAIGEGAHIGNFVEIKNASVENGAKVNHLTYIGDARVGAWANIGAGTITCNYDGYFKSHTDIGVGAFIGSNTSLVAPVKVGDGAIIGAGSVVARDVPDNALALTRGPHAEKNGWARDFRERRAAEKTASSTSRKS